MKIAAISDDGVTISQHFGRAPLYVVVTVEDDKIVGKETRDKSGHHTFAAHHPDIAPGERHGYDAGSQVRHANMAGAHFRLPSSSRRRYGLGCLRESKEL